MSSQDKAVVPVVVPAVTSERPLDSSRATAISAFVTAGRRLRAAHAAVQQTVDRKIDRTFDQIAAVLSSPSDQAEAMALRQNLKTDTATRQAALCNRMAFALHKMAITDIAAAAAVADAASEAATVILDDTLPMPSSEIRPKLCPPQEGGAQAPNQEGIRAHERIADESDGAAKDVEPPPSFGNAATRDRR
jgi:hypothetical protein